MLTNRYHNGGSMGGFITWWFILQTPDVIQIWCQPLRSVTDWAALPIMANTAIFSTPRRIPNFLRKSSPIFCWKDEREIFLNGNMAWWNVNVHFQDVVRLSQRLIELGKKQLGNWRFTRRKIQWICRASSWQMNTNNLKLFQHHPYLKD